MLRPFNPAHEALQIAGVIKKSSNGSQIEPSLVKDVLDSHGASLDDAAAALAIALKSDDTNLPAARLAFQLHGALREAETPTIPVVNISVVAASSQNTLLKFVMPSADLPCEELENANI